MNTTTNTNKVTLNDRRNPLCGSPLPTGFSHQPRSTRSGPETIESEERCGMCAEHC